MRKIILTEELYLSFFFTFLHKGFLCPFARIFFLDVSRKIGKMFPKSFSAPEMNIHQVSNKSVANPCVCVYVCE